MHTGCKIALYCPHLFNSHRGMMNKDLPLHVVVCTSVASQSTPKSSHDEIFQIVFEHYWR